MKLVGQIIEKEYLSRRSFLYSIYEAEQGDSSFNKVRRLPSAVKIEGVIFQISNYIPSPFSELKGDNTFSLYKSFKEDSGLPEYQRALKIGLTKGFPNLKVSGYYRMEMYDAEMKCYYMESFPYDDSETTNKELEEWAEKKFIDYKMNILEYEEFEHFDKQAFDKAWEEAHTESN